MGFGLNFDQANDERWRCLDETAPEDVEAKEVEIKRI